MRRRWMLVGLAFGAAIAAVVVWLVRGRPVEPASAPDLPLADEVEDSSDLSPDGAWQRVSAPRGRGVLVVAVRDDAGNPIPARLTFRGIEGTRTPAFTRTDVGLERPGSVSAFDRVFMTGDTALLVPAGSYEVWFSHGPEWDAVVRKIRLAPTTMASLAVTLHHVVDTPGWVSGDFHVHASPSSDSRVPMKHRLMQFLADGVDVIVSTDHDTISNYAPIIAQLGAGDRIASIQGDEVTTKDWGHFGAFPLDNTSPAPATGNGRVPASLFPEIRQHWPGGLIDIHHPRLENGKIGYFHLGELDTRTLEAKRKGFSFDFDAIEVLNGYQDPDRRSVDAVLTDWFAFLKRGHRITGTGNSDTHHMTFNLGGFPRNYVQMTERPFDAAALAAAVKAGKSYFTTGPVVDVSVGDAGLGDTVSGATIALHVRVRAPAWIDVTRLTVLVDGVVAIKRPVTGVAPLRFEETIDVPIKEDGFVIVRVDGDRPMAPIIGDEKKFRVFPLAITNPIWVDFDGDGKITPPVR